VSDVPEIVATYRRRAEFEREFAATLLEKATELDEVIKDRKRPGRSGFDAAREHADVMGNVVELKAIVMEGFADVLEAIHEAGHQ